MRPTTCPVSPCRTSPCASTAGHVVSLREPSGARSVLFLYPRTGRPGVDALPGWDDIPGARGCTPEACGFRDLLGELTAAGASRVLGLSSQSADDQCEAAERLHLSYPLLSDPDLRLADALRLPTFETSGRRLYARQTLVLRHDLVEHVFYPVFPPDGHAAEVLAWLRTTPS